MDNQHRYYKWIAGIFALCLICQADAQSIDTIEIADNSKAIIINDNSKVFHTSDTLSGIQAWKAIKLGELEELEEKTNPGMKFPGDEYWIVFSFHNSENEDVSSVIELNYPQIDHVRLFAIEDGIPRLSFTTGDRFPFEQRPIRYRNIALPVEVAAGSNNTYLMCVEKRMSATRFPMVLIGNEDFFDHKSKEYIIYGLFFGFGILVSLISLAVGLATSKQVFIFYAMYVIVLAFWLFTKLGLTYQFIAGEYPSANQHLLPISSSLLIVFGVFYFRSFFNTSKRFKRSDQILKSIVLIIAVVFVIWGLFPDFVLTHGISFLMIKYLLSITLLSIVLVVVIRSLKTDKYYAVMFICSYGLFLIIMQSKIYAEFGLLPESIIKYEPIMFAFLIEILILSIAMASKLKRTVVQMDSFELEKSEFEEARVAAEKKLLNRGKIFIKLNSKAVIQLHKLVYINTDDHYLEFWLEGENKPEVDRNSMKHVMDQLPLDRFIQIHRSTVVNLEYARAVYGEELMLNDGRKLKVSRKFKNNLKETLGA